MPITCRFMDDEGLIVFRHEGVVTDEEFLATYKSHHQDPRFEQSHDILVDLRDADSGVRSPEALRSIATFRSRLLGDAAGNPRVAVVAPTDISYGLARMYEAYSDALPFEFVVFKDIGAALAWLRVPEDLLDDGFD